MNRTYDQKIISYHSAISSCLDSGKWELAIELLEEMETRRGLVPTAAIFGLVICACSIAGEHSRALSLLDEMKARALKSSLKIFVTMLVELEKSEQWERAVNLIDSMPARGVVPTSECFDSAIGACDRASQWDEVSAPVLFFLSWAFYCWVIFSIFSGSTAFRMRKGTWTISGN